ncbi:L,D-transpeptidase family protein [Magnetofaba australis]|uniref:Putative ErfK/YbiS/YcfS/YnhG family protein n=1 Tax=Magnetofaba australis IT-1 TaxID=1434232 RepID=A0A1Y2K1V6_9PROT|nr:L,D-transpeptidase family protein [Magnetofaba australis]OSM01647.1 putative ErfK/YbiS/YcfS/YnhG family protein [Magnetofaba australis IT-1]
MEWIVITLLALTGAGWFADTTLPGWLADDLPKADLVLVDKQRRRLHLMRDDAVIRSYRVSLGGAPQGHKQQEGDQRTPEGDYLLDWRNPNSRFHKSLHVSYPNAQDSAAAEARGVSPGGEIMIHGLPNGWGWFPWGFQGRDWTLGCVAVESNVAMEEIWRAVSDGAPIRIY